jgi:hypothetical protein
MRRRKLLAGLGSLAAGGAALMGTGAMPAMSAERDANIEVVADSGGIISMSSDTTSDVVRENGDQLQIDFSSNGGINIDSVYQVGRLFNILRPQMT